MHLSFVQCVGTWLETEREAESNQKLLKLPLVFSSPFSHYFGHWKDMLRPCLQRGTQVGSLMAFVHTQMKKCLHMKYWWHTSELSEVPVTIDQVCHEDEMVCISSTWRFYYRQSYAILQWQWDRTDFTCSKDSAITHKCHIILWIYIEMCTCLSKHVTGHYQKTFTNFTYVHKWQNMQCGKVICLVSLFVN